MDLQFLSIRFRHVLHLPLIIHLLLIFYQVFEWVIVVRCQLSKFSAISWREQINFQRDDDEVHFVLGPKKYMCVSDCMVFKIRVGRSGFFFFFNAPSSKITQTCLFLSYYSLLTIWHAVQCFWFQTSIKCTRKWRKLLKSETNTETETNFWILPIYFFFWHNFFLGSVDRSETHVFFFGPRPTRLVGFFIVLADRHVSPLGHIILIPSQPFFALLLLNVACLAEKQQIPIKVVGLTQSGSNPRSTALIPFEQVWLRNKLINMCVRCLFEYITVIQYSPSYQETFSLQKGDILTQVGPLYQHFNFFVLYHFFFFETYSINFMAFFKSISPFTHSLVCSSTLYLEPHTLHLIQVINCRHTFLKNKSC